MLNLKINQMSKILKISSNSDLNFLEVGDQFNMRYLEWFSLFDLFNFDDYWEEIELRSSCGHIKSTVNYISKDYLIFDKHYIMLNLHSK